MPEGHTIHRLAAQHRTRFAGHPVLASSPQGRFAAGAALVDGRELESAEAHGKHLFLGFAGPAGPDWIHIHLGLFGTYALGDGTPPPATDTVRLRLEHDGAAWSDLRGPTACELLTDADKKAIHDRLGPDPLRDGTDPEPAWRRVTRSRTPVATLLMDQRVVSGVGNVYRAEVLFRHGVDPYRAGRDLDRATFDAMWDDLAALMREGVRLGRIDTVRPEHTPEAMGRPPRVDDHGGEVYVYRRAGLPCLLCGTAIRTAGLGNRNLFWCPRCQQP
ncbi:zinc finger domain-containing protein [Streptomyces sp. SL13]|jgi:endonuclease-8|uniref:Endonuclease 8 1 n=1 Tax=Streptantibioticus silvisoli TaxID=2705255 RepID=A0AA90HA18_9ACTN|nr:DNA-formamidopyrimidine glycosylase family protein [Streptantibioticus silvisoli]MDI5964757.1 zinc finger domain-containing protein [Streptantibioticus silvisoli]MDI5973099.1 zinc finger domain-containing protein [Streptantibioticus silvisoli]